MLDNLYGLTEILQYQQNESRSADMKERTKKLEEINRELKGKENTQRVVTDGVILAAGILMAVIAGQLVMAGALPEYEAVVTTIRDDEPHLDPSAALSALSNNLHHTVGKRQTCARHLRGGTSGGGCDRKE